MKYKIALLTDFLNEQKIAAFKFLSLSQQKYIERKPDYKAEQSICARMLLADLLCDENNHTNKEILSNISFSSDKRPYIEGMKDVFISISHSENAVAVAFSDKPIGIDIQKITDVNPRVAKRTLTEEELNYLSSSDMSEFFMLWTAKEALIKTGACSYSSAINTSFVKENRITSPDGFILKQERFKDFAVSIIEQSK